MGRQFTSEERKFLRREIEPEYSIYSRFLENPSGAEINAQIRGLPLTVNANGNYEVVLAGAEASATAFGIEFERYCVPAGGLSQRKIPGIEHGPIVVSVEGLPPTDPAGNAYNIADLVTALEALAPKVRVTDYRTNLQATVGA